jgi:predicted RND superfamily exporter protein
LIFKDERKRLAFAFRRAARSTLTTSCTTAAAFLANAFNPIMPMASFGIYAAILILVVYAIIVLFFPPLLIFYERHLKNRCNCCFKKDLDSSDRILKAKEKGKVAIFFGQTVNNFVARYKFILLTLFGIWTIVAFILATSLTPLSKEEEFLPENHKINLLQNDAMKSFGSSGIMDIDVNIYWGVKDIDKSKASMWDAHYIGEVIWDEKFSIYPKDAQMSIVNLCKDLKGKKG